MNISWLEKGIQNIEHIYDYRKKDFYSFQKLNELYLKPFNDFLKYKQIVSSIPKEWKIRLKKKKKINPQQNDTVFNKLLKSNKVNKMLYNFQLKHQPSLPIKAEEKMG